MPTTSLRKLKRKLGQPHCVRFEEDDDRQVKRRVVEVESVLNIAEKRDLWLQPDEVSATMQSVREENQLLRLDTTTFETYVDALADVYCICCSEDDSDSASSISPSHVALLGLARGTEPCSLPDLALVRSERRRYSIQNVVQIYRLLENDSQRDSIVAALAANVSAGAKRFAQVLGVADATASMLQQLEPCTPSIIPLHRPVKSLDSGYHRTTVLLSNA